jgi:serine-type D-Ala-D-Ala carboxypeptidase
MKLRYGTPEEAGVDPGRVEGLKALARSWVEDGVHPSLVVLAARRGVIFLHEAFGTLRPGEDAPVQSDSIFDISSATKPLTAACVMALVEDGKIGLMRPVTEYCPEIEVEGADGMLIHHLLAHLSGWRDLDVHAEIARRYGERLPEPEPGQHRDVAAYIHLGRTAPLHMPAGTAMQYCQLNYDLLGEIVRRVSGKPLDQFARERIFDPLGMKDTSYGLPQERGSRKARRGPGMPGSEFLSRFNPGSDSRKHEEQVWGSRGGHASAMDMAAFGQMLLNKGVYDGHRVLSSASVDAMTRNQVPPGVRSLWTRTLPDGTVGEDEFPGGYGYGLFPFQNTATPYFNGGLASGSSFGHAASTGVNWWADVTRELVGVYFSVVARNVPATGLFDWRADIFVDAVTAAVED